MVPGAREPLGKRTTDLIRSVLAPIEQRLPWRALVQISNAELIYVSESDAGPSGCAAPGGHFFAAKKKIVEEPCESLRRMTTPMAQHSSVSWIRWRERGKAKTVHSVSTGPLWFSLINKVLRPGASRRWKAKAKPWWASLEGCSSNTNSVQKRWNSSPTKTVQTNSAWIYRQR